MKNAGRGFARQLRVGAQMTRLLSELLRTEVKDPRLADVRINEVDLSGDLGVAKVYFSMLLPDSDTGPALEAFEKARGFLRSRLGAALQLRRVPELRFIADSSVKDAMELTSLIDAQRVSADGAD
jgi:ribosome-binding factor A